MVESVNWAKTLISKQYGDRLARDGGVDFDGNGKIEEKEQFGDLNKNGTTGDADDYLSYLEANRPYIEKQIEFVGFQQGFSPNNIIHQVLFIESEMFSAEDVKKAYQILGDILAQVKRELNENMTNEEKARLVYEVMRSRGFGFQDQENALFINNLLRKSVDCDTSSFVVLAVAQELNWPVTLVDLLYHTFVRWVGDKPFNIDFGEIRSDKDIRLEPSWDDRPLSVEGIISHAYTLRGDTKSKL